MSSVNLDLCICIPTYKRTESLINLLSQLSSQSMKPAIVIIVDGDLETDTTLKAISSVLQNIRIPQIIYLPSNHANLPYQRYLGWKVAREFPCNYLLFLDDDMQIIRPEVIKNLLEPFEQDNSVMGVTANVEHKTKGKVIRKENLLVTLFGDFQKFKPGNLTPSGNRIPVEFAGSDYTDVKYLSGGAMAFRINTLKDKAFSQDLFAMYEIKAGKGEDTILSLRARGKGSYVFVFSSTMKHPNNKPVAYPSSYYQKAYAIAYSRRLINDNYRGLEKPLLIDRLALLKSYIGNFLVLWGNAIFTLQKGSLLYAFGFTRGALHGIFSPPRTENLTPNINWHNDAEIALNNLQILKNGLD